MAQDWMQRPRRSTAPLLVGDLADRRSPLDGRTPCHEIDLIFQADPVLRSVVVSTSSSQLALVNRSRFYQGLIGPLGYGRALYYRRPVELVVEDNDIVLQASTGAVDAGLSLLDHQAVRAFDDVLVRWEDGDVGTLPVVTLFSQLSRFHAEQVDEIALSERRFRSLVQNSTDVVMVLDSDGTVCYLSPSAQHVTGQVPEERVGHNAFAAVHPDDLETFRRLLDQSLGNPGAELAAESRMRVADGSWRAFEFVGRNLLHDPAVAGIVLNFRDVTDRRELESQLRHQAFHDPLTGLANRALFSDRLSHAMERLEPSTLATAVIFCDLDGFKAVNDTLGHTVGDELLVAVGERLRSCLRDADTLARFGGDEFAALVEGISEEEATGAAERILTALRRPFVVSGKEVLAQASVGIALATPPAAVDSVIRRADVAMYAAKSGGKNCYAWWEPVLQASVIRRHELASDLRRARERNELSIDYQPVVALDTGRLLGVEALLRWHHPTHGSIPPMQFIPVAEETGLIRPIGRWVLEEACRQACAWQVEFPSVAPFTISVNLSPVQLAQPGFPTQVRDVLEVSGLTPRLLELEITETALMRDLDVAKTTLQEVKRLGVRMALDDFGTGYSSLSYLRAFPFDNLKIDKSFVDQLEEEGSGTVIIDGIVRLAHSLGLEVTAEGIETERQLEELRSIGCEQGQGYLFARPLAAPELRQLLITELTSRMSTGTLVHRGMPKPLSPHTRRPTTSPG